MCGIAGWLGHVSEHEDYAEKMAQRLRHRGPDSTGVRSWPTATLVQTRLKIIDLTPTGAQPMANEDGSIWTVFNGEIYNHHGLRHALEARGHKFVGRSDTEVLPHLYEEYGRDLVTKLRGMFTFAIFDTRNNTLLLARDRFGIKPLFYGKAKDLFAFASEIRPLLELPGIDDTPDRQAIFDFATLFHIPAPETFYSGIRALQPGEVLTAEIHDHKVAIKTRMFHTWSIAPDLSLTLKQAVDRTDELIMAAVHQQLESDVALGSLLSGGIDSSLVSAAAQASAKEKIRTFNVRFPEKEYDETWAALAVADHIGSWHETLNMNSAQGTWENVTGLLRHAGQPFADTSLFAVNAVCRLMRQYVTVALSGDGGDEGFGGYNIFWRIARILRLQKLPASIWHGASSGVSPLIRFGVVADHLQDRIRDLTGADDAAIVQSLFCWLSEKEHRNLCVDDNLLPVRRLFEPQWQYHLQPLSSRLERLSAHATEANIRLQLPNDFLFKVDVASMRESLEVRVPMLDEELIAFGLSLPHELKVKGRTCKRVLREVARRRLPEKIANKPKHGFGIPLDKWVDSGFKCRLRETLLDSSSRLPEFFKPEIYRSLVLAFCENRPFPGVSRKGLYQRNIMLLSAHLALSKAL